MIAYGNRSLNEQENNHCNTVLDWKCWPLSLMLTTSDRARIPLFASISIMFPVLIEIEPESHCLEGKDKKTNVH